MDSNNKILKELRYHLHQHPELSGEEYKTSQYIVQFLSGLKGIDIVKDIGKTGIIATLDSGNPGPTLMFRCELDALPIQEINDFEHKSNTAGVSHKCGHDGHMTILCGLAQKISNEGLKSGKVHLLFQPAEETGEGAKAILEDAQFKLEPDFVFALHNTPGFERGTVVVKDKAFTPSVNSMIIDLTGKTSHAAEPENGINPIWAISEILQQIKPFIIENKKDENFSLITPVYSTVGSKAYGTSPGDGQLHLTIRCWDDGKLKALDNKIRDVVQQTAKKHQLKVDISYTQTFHSNYNDEVAMEHVRQALGILNYQVLELTEPFKWGEDFGLFTSRFKGCMFGIGAGLEHPDLHNPDYDFPDEITEVGVNCFYQIAKNILNQ